MSEAVHIVCPHCDSINRIPSDRLADRPRCGQCKTALFSGHPVDLHRDNFQRHLQRNDIPVLVDFWAPWCGPCKMMAPMFERAAAELEPQVRLAKLNTEDEQALAGQYGIRSIPTLMLFRGGQVVAQQAGAMDTRQLVSWVRGKL